MYTCSLSIYIYLLSLSLCLARLAIFLARSTHSRCTLELLILLCPAVLRVGLLLRP